MKVSRTALRKTRDERIVDLERADPTMIGSRAEFAHEIRTLWDDARDRLMRIGRMIVQARRVLPHGEFEEMIRHDLPFDRSVAFQLRTVYESIEEGRFRIEELPEYYSTAYQIVSMKPDVLQRARAEGLVHPQVRRSEIIEFKRRVTVGGVSDARIRSLLASRQKLLEKLRAVEAEMQDLGIDPDTDISPVIDGAGREIGPNGSGAGPNRT